jgi:hypothetical protein
MLPRLLERIPDLSRRLLLGGDTPLVVPGHYGMSQPVSSREFRVVGRLVAGLCPVGGLPDRQHID